MPNPHILNSDEYKRARALLQAGRLQEARTLFGELCALDQEDAGLWLVLAGVNGRLGDAAAAEMCARKAVALSPEWAEAHFNLAVSLREQKRLTEATDAFNTAIKLEPELPGPRNALGCLLATQGQFKAAEQHLRRAVELDPEFADAYNNLGNTLRAASRNEEAIACYSRAVEIQPGNLDAMLNLAGLLSKMARIEDAIEWDRRILALKPDFAEVYYHLGNLFLGVDRLEEAVESFRSARNIKPEFCEAIGAEAQALQKLGRFDESDECIQSALKQNRKGAAIAAALAAVATDQGRQDEAIAMTEDLLRQYTLSNEERQQLHFAAGRIYDEQERYLEAFEHYRQANALYRGRFSREQHGRRIANSIALFQSDRIPDLPVSTVVSDLPVFIVGMPRSGTSLVEQILASHPRIFGAGELNDINQYANDFQARFGGIVPYPACLEGLSPSILDNLASQYLERLDGMAGAVVRVTDKMPHNFLHLGMIAMLFPGARIIHAQRDPVDTCLSIYFQKFNELHAYAHNLSDLGYYYRTYEKLMAHWRSVLGLPLFEIRYEELVAEPETWIPRLVEFCGVEWDERCMRFHETRRSVNTLSNEQVRQPMYTRSVDRWRNYETQLEPLILALTQEV